MNDAHWPFTETVTPHLLVNWSKSPIYDKCLDHCEVCKLAALLVGATTKRSISNIFPIPLSESKYFLKDLKISHVYEDPFDINGSIFSLSLFIQKLIIETFVSTLWTNWMDIIIKAIKYKVHRTFEGKIQVLAIHLVGTMITNALDVILKIRGRMFFKWGSMMPKNVGSFKRVHVLTKTLGEYKKNS